jgi:signal transduction histidine kinase
VPLARCRAAVASCASGGLCCAAVALATVLTLGAGCEAAAAPWRVVILPGTDPTQPAVVLHDRAFRNALEAAAPDGVEFYTDSVDGVRFHNTDVMPEFVALLARKYERREVDLVVGVVDFALEFLERHHERLWPGKPVLILGMEERRLRERGLPPHFAHVPLHIDVDGTLAIAEALQPEARRLVVVAGTGAFDLAWAQRAAEAARRRPTRWTAVEVWIGVPMHELRPRLAALDRRTAVLYPSMYRDREGHAYFPAEAVKPMAEVSGAPIYSWYTTYLDRGATAGSVLDLEDQGRRGAELAASILRRTTAPAGATLSATAPRCMANVGRIEALGLDAGALPAGCSLVHAPPSLWRDHRREAVGVMVLLALQAVTITGLLVQRRRRRGAEEVAVRRGVELSRAARVATVGELSASIAHEVGQPLSAIVTNTEVVELMLARGACDAGELHAIVTDVRRDALRAHAVVRRLHALLEKHSVDFTRLDLNATFDEALELIGPEARRRGVSIERSFAAGGAPLAGDGIQLQQVLLNLAINAMDAMRDNAAGQRMVSVTLRRAGEGYELQVADRGHGLPPGPPARLFDSFFTTKPHGIGLGLSIVRTVVGAHGGRVSAAPRDGGGSVFTVWLPCAGTGAQGAGQDAAADAQAAPEVEPWRAVPGGLR